MSIKSFVLSAALLGIISAPTMASKLTQPAGSNNDALLERQLIDRDLASRTAPIHSQADARRYIASNAGRKTPFTALSRGAQERFLQSLVFTTKGLASFEYADLSAELTATQVYKLLALFGAQDSTHFIPNLRVVDSTDAAIVDKRNAKIGPLTDYPGYKCSPPATCEPSFSTICIGSNCLVR
ncbi:hypothetical protein [Cognatiluteimonas profundi]|uniref:hypothetical protein n=1 Tax=Cognatiluteimonas profundi TaxID=2594501 RepID=UPI00131BC58E|nr:hypothetical protein [Lysobacter profundi]